MALFACMYFAALRPAEAVSLRLDDFYLPLKGWERLTLDISRPGVNRQWTDTGNAHEERGLKHRREVTLVSCRSWLNWSRSFGNTSPGSALPKMVVSSAASGVEWSLHRATRRWQKARGLALTPTQAASPLARTVRPEACRWLNGGVPAPQVAKRAGHGVDVLLRVYAKCIDGQEEIVNQRIEEALTA